jgi:outer membrane protein OmpA-like peptidoglycan-associated protein
MLSLLTTLALAQDTFTDAEIPPIDVQHFRPSMDARHTLWADDSRRGEHKRFFARPLFHYTRQPLVYEFDEQAGLPDRDPVAIVNNILQGDMMAGYAFDRFRVGVGLPVYFYADGQGQPSQSGIGDVALDGKFTLLDGGAGGAGDGGPGVALTGRVTLPTSTIRTSDGPTLPLGNANPGWELAAVVDQMVGDRLFFTGNLGFRGGNKVRLENVDLNDFLVVRAAGAYLFDEDAGVALEVAGDIPFTSDVQAGMPLEVMLDGYSTIAPDVTIRGGVGRGLTSGIAAPDLRVVLGFEWRPQKDTDLDDDGIDDVVDACPDIPEDLDGEKDDDGCPEDVGSIVVKVVGPDGTVLDGAQVEVGDAAAKGGETVSLPGGTYDVTATAEGHEPGTAEVTVVDADEGREVVVTLQEIVIPMGTLSIRVEDPDGNPVETAVIKVGDGTTTGAEASLELSPGTYEVDVMADGFKHATVTAPELADEATVQVVLTLEPAAAKLEGARIDLRDRVYFDLAKATIQERSYALLEDVVGILIDHPELTKLRIEGHTDSRGGAAANKALSQRRADAVMQFLIGKGIAPERLEAVGYGEEKPLDPASNEEAWAKNRRVDFFVAERSDE